MKINEKEDKQEKTTVRDTLYGRVDISVKTMDKVLLALIMILIASIIFGVIL